MQRQADDGIAWCTHTWNPLRGCSRISPGCVNCYAERMAARFSKPGFPFHGYAKLTTDGPRWTGKVSLLDTKKLEAPLYCRTSKTGERFRIFVNSMSDTFHEGLPSSDIDRIFNIIQRTPQHTYQVLTKRAHRMRQYFMQQRTLQSRSGHFNYENLPNVWSGISVENQRSVDDRVPNLLSINAFVRWLSVEPLLERIVIPKSWLAGIDWVVIGGESGRGARRFDMPWVYELVEQCRAAKVAVFVKQMGSNAYNEPNGVRDVVLTPADRVRVKFKDGSGADPAEWPKDLQIQEWPDPRRRDHEFQRSTNIAAIPEPIE